MCERGLAGTGRVGQACVRIGGEVDFVRGEIGFRAECVPDADAHAARRQVSNIGHRRRTWVPCNMRNDVGVRRVARVPVCGPVCRAYVYLHVAANASAVLAYFQHGVPEIRSRLEVPSSWVDHAHWCAFGHAQVCGTQRAVVPDGLDVTFGYDFVDSVHESSVLFWTATMIAHKTRRKQGENCQKNATDLYVNCMGIVWELSRGGTGETRNPCGGFNCAFYWDFMLYALYTNGQTTHKPRTTF